MNNLGCVCHAMGRLDDARDLLQRVIEMRADNPASCCLPLGNLATVHRDAGRLGDAFDCARDAVSTARASGSRQAEGINLNVLGSIHHKLNDSHRAAQTHAQALRVGHEIGNRTIEIDALAGLAAAYRRLGRLHDALNLANQALETARQTGSRRYEGVALAEVAEAHLALGDHSLAAHRAELAIDIHRRTGHRLSEARCLVTLGDARGATAAEPCWLQALEILTAAGSAEADTIRALLAPLHGD